MPRNKNLQTPSNQASPVDGSVAVCYNKGNLNREALKMQETIARPSWIIGFERPPGTEIKHINGHYYLYERLSVYDPKTKKKRKKSGRLIGTITPDGLVRKKERLESAELTCIENREYGASMFLYQSSSAIAAKLEACFPLVWSDSEPGTKSAQTISACWNPPPYCFSGLTLSPFRFCTRYRPSYRPSVPLKYTKPVWTGCFRQVPAIYHTCR